MEAATKLTDGACLKRASDPFSDNAEVARGNLFRSRDLTSSPLNSSTIGTAISFCLIVKRTWA